MKNWHYSIFKTHLLISTLVILSLIVLSLSMFAGCDNSVDAAPAEEIARQYTNTIISRMLEGNLTSVADDMLHAYSGCNPIFNNINGNGLEGINRAPASSRSQEEILRDTVLYVKNLFGENAWTTVEFTLDETFAETGQVYWQDLRDGSIYNEAQYNVVISEYINKTLTDNGIDIETADMNSLQILELIDTIDNDLPFEIIRKSDGKTWQVNFSFCGATSICTGERNFRLVITDTNNGFKILQSFTWDGAQNSIPNSDDVQSAPELVDNSTELPVDIADLINIFVSSVNESDVDTLSSFVNNRQTLWRPISDSTIYITDNEQIEEQIKQFKAYSGLSAAERPSIFGYKIDCLNYSELNKTVWIETSSGIKLTSDEAAILNNEYVIDKCDEYEISYNITDEGVLMIDWVGLDLLSQNGVYRSTYPVQAVPYVDNPFVLYKIVLYFENLSNPDNKYFTFYISNQTGDYKIISALYYEKMVECGVSVQNHGD